MQNDYREKTLFEHLEAYRKKFYLNRVIRGGIILGLIFSSFLLLFVLGEGFFGFSSIVRTIIFFAFNLGFFGVLAYMVIWPLFQMLKLANGIGEMDVAQMIRSHFPEIDDKVVNLIQLKQNRSSDTDLVFAAISKKTEELAPIPFSRAINLNVNWKMGRLLLIPSGLFVLFLAVYPLILKDGAIRLFHYNKSYPKPKPYLIDILNHPAHLVSGQAFTVETKISGKDLPADLFLYLKKKNDPAFVNYPMDRISPDAFEFEFSDLKEDFEYYVGNEEVVTSVFNTEVLKRPSIRNFKIILDFPSYTGLKRDTLPENIGDFKVLKGCQVTWLLEPGSEIARATFMGTDTLEFVKSGSQFSVQKKPLLDETYFLSLTSPRNVLNADTVRYHIEISQDRYPHILVTDALQNFEADFEMVLPLDFEISDDFGFSKLSLEYRYVQSKVEGKIQPDFATFPLNFQGRSLLQKKSLEVDLENLGMVEGDRIEYRIVVWDNDYVSGPKSSVSTVYFVNYKSITEKHEEVGESQEKMEAEMDKLTDQLKDIAKRYEKMQEKMLSQKSMNYDDKKELKSLLQEQKQVSESIKSMQEKFEKNKETLKNNEMISQATLEKYEKLNEFMKSIENPLLEKLMKNLQENMEKLSPEEIRKQMEQMELNEKDLLKSIERTMELLKQLQVEQKMEEISAKLDNLKEKQDMLNEKTDQAKNDEELKALKEKQDALNKEFEDLKKELEKLKDMKADTQTPSKEQMEELEKQAEEAKEEMKDAAEQMDDGKKSNASKSQKGASKKMQEMKDQMQEMQAAAGAEMEMENLENLRDILENLLTLSFDQEDLRDETKDLRFGDPQVLERARGQKNLRDDMSMVRDSLFELAKKAFQIEKVITDESNKIVESMAAAQSNLDLKNTGESAKQQHLAMTSINNLANMLADVMDQMQQNIKNSGKPSASCKKPGEGMPNMKKMGEQQKELNGKMKDMFEKMNGEGKGMDPKKLAEMAAQQEMLRKQLKEGHEKIQKEGGKSLGDLSKIMEEMEETEDELKNNQLTSELLARQQRILNRLLDATKSVREKEEYDEKRESKTAKEFQKKAPGELKAEELKNRIRQEMLKSNQMEYSSDFILLIEQYFNLIQKNGVAK